MKGILTKDIISLKINYKTVLFCELFISVLSALSSFKKGAVSAVIPIGSAILAEMLTMALFFEDEKTGFDKTIALFPISRRQEVLGRYISALLTAAAQTVIFFIPVTAGAFMGGHSDITPIISAALLLFTICLVFAAIIYLSIYGPGAKKGKKGFYSGRRVHHLRYWSPVCDTRTTFLR
ncbi:ABC-2 transporter permease [Ruminococcus albus]|uniref:Conserved domain protein n=1 Tax=Ruminococcus albus 8 TaxID=246199 RepID=E9SAR8_RUMAL|nr:ABC-2 transporter permease [Ruminococcus albus]EGC03616.1 conserved domain protein [Ruminococcus albus 8]MCC3349889.1 ABC-2 transporter permease [Ruminococcus albus 8]